MYSYCVTTAPSGSTIGAIKCRLVKNSEEEYLVCLKRHSLDIYSLKNVSSDGDGDSNSIHRDHNTPILMATLKAYSTLIAFVEYRPPGSCQSHLLVLTKNYLLILLTYDELNSKFVSRPLVSMQESSCNKIEGQVLLKVDKDYNLILFYGLKRIIKCIILNKRDYFNFYDLVTLRTNDNILLDIEFMSIEYKKNHDRDTSNPYKLDDTQSPATSSKMLLTSKDSTDKYVHTKKENKVFLECKIVVLGQDTYALSNEGEPIRWLYGMQLFFEIEDGVGCRRFNSYGHTPLFGDPIPLSCPYNMFIPLTLNNTLFTSDSTLLLGAGGIGFITFKDPKSIKSFHLNFYVSEITSYSPFEDDKYVIGDDNGNIYVLELVLGNSLISTGLKRRVRSVNTSVTLPRTSSDTVVTDVIVTRVGVSSIPTSIVQIGPNVIFLASRMSNSSTLKISYRNGTLIDNNVFNTNTGDIYKLWSQTNLGPITDFTFGEENNKGCKSILACCGVGSTGKLCNISLGVGVDVLCSINLIGIYNLFSVSTPNSDDAILCCSFYRYTRFYSIALNGEPKSNNILEASDISVGRIFKIKLDGFTEDHKTILLDHLDKELLVQVTPRSVLIVTCKSFELVIKKDVEDFEICNTSNIVLANVCGDFILVLLSNHVIVLLDPRSELSVVNYRGLSLNVSSIAYISKDDVKCGSGDLIALSTWGNCMILILSVLKLSTLYEIKVPCNFGVYIKSLKFGIANQKVYLFVGLSNGKLLIYKIAEDGNEYSVKLDNVIQISNKSINIDTIKTSKSHTSHNTCDLSHINLITTGDDSTAIYCNKTELEFASVNIPQLYKLCGLKLSLETEFGAVIAYYTASKLVIGRLDTIEKLHVQTVAAGRTFDKVCYHSQSNLAIVACPPELKMVTNDSNNIDVDDNINVLMCFDDFSEGSRSATKLPALAKFINVKNKETVYNLRLPHGHLVSSICTVSFDGVNELIAIGSSKISDSQDLPIEGYLYLVHVSECTEDKIVLKMQKTIEPFDGGIVEMIGFNNTLAIAVNHKVLVLTKNIHSDNKKYHLEYLYSSDEEEDESLALDAQYNSNTFVVSLDCSNDNIVVGDLITSVKLLKYNSNRLYEICRDFNSLWCTAVSAIDDDTSIVSDDSGNFSIFSRDPMPSNDEKRAKFNTIGLFHHGEIVNKIKRYNATPITTDYEHAPITLGSPLYNCSRDICCKVRHIYPDTSITQSPYINCKFNKFLICATSSGSIIQICMFDDFKLFLRLSLLEEVLINIQSDIGNIANNKWHNFQNTDYNLPSKGFIDGDTIECFLNLSPEMKSKVLDALKDSSKDLDLGICSVDSLTFEIEHLKRIR